MTRLIAAYPISNEDLSALPVRALDQAIRFYETVLGFATLERSPADATLARDGVELRLVMRDDHEPGLAGSLAIEVDELDALHGALAREGARPSEFGIDEWNARRHRTFFLREDDNGYCYCFYRPLSLLEQTIRPETGARFDFSIVMKR